MRAALWIVSTFLVLAIAGCESPPSGTTTGSGSGAVQHAPAPTNHYLAQNRVASIGAGETFWMSFSAGSAPVHYRWARTDGSTVDTGFIRASDYGAYESGYTVNTWAYEKETAGAEDQASLPAGTPMYYIIHCDDAIANCDGTFTLWAYE